MSRFALASLQLELSSVDNLDRLAKEIRLTKKRFPWIDMLMLPELSAYGINRSFVQAFGGEAEQHFQALARETGLWLLPGSLYLKDGGQIYNVAPVIAPTGELVARAEKLLPWQPYETGIAAGRHYCVFDLPGVGRIGLCICYDNWFPEVMRSLVCLGAEVILCPTMTNTIDRDLELAIARSNAAVQQVYFVSLNIAGPLGNGRSIVVAPDGKVLHQAGTGNEVIPMELDLELVRRVRERGLDGLGQPLKSFRDYQLGWPAYQKAAADQPGLRTLGPLQMPTALLASPKIAGP